MFENNNLLEWYRDKNIIKCRDRKTPNNVDLIARISADKAKIESRKCNLNGPWKGDHSNVTAGGIFISSDPATLWQSYSNCYMVAAPLHSCGHEQTALRGHHFAQFLVLFREHRFALRGGDLIYDLASTLICRVFCSLPLVLKLCWAMLNAAEGLSRN